MGKTEADNLKKVEMSWLKKYGYLNGWKSATIEWTSGWDNSKSSIGIVGMIGDDSYVRFYYTQTNGDGEKKDFDYKVRLTTTPCRYGRFRYWFICPLTVNGTYCGKRVGVLYKAGDYFGCRHCYDLTYRSRNENRHGKMYLFSRFLDEDRRAERLEQKIKRYMYGGQPTKKAKRLMRIQDRMMPYAESVLRGHPL